MPLWGLGCVVAFGRRGRGADGCIEGKILQRVALNVLFFLPVVVTVLARGLVYVGPWFVVSVVEGVPDSTGAGREMASLGYGFADAYGIELVVAAVLTLGLSVWMMAPAGRKFLRRNVPIPGWVVAVNWLALAVQVAVPMVF